MPAEKLLLFQKKDGDFKLGDRVSLNYLEGALGRVEALYFGGAEIQLKNSDRKGFFLYSWLDVLEEPPNNNDSEPCAPAPINLIDCVSVEELCSVVRSLDSVTLEKEIVKLWIFASKIAEHYLCHIQY
jgi:hypothetical protein